ncbi:PREDICTED: uncharacterized protein LOC105117465 [Populus euphratica]|uniref:RING-type E3 ubiquitin transferase n=1 Tax=Populus euphratica TaxID=75702 RepID=A0AAJ6XCE6_POPEU|nr:PREDICTED: uncharacterized protein LOC105117465 [Populus euphratica]
MTCDRIGIEVEASFMPPILDEEDLKGYKSQLVDHYYLVVDVDCEWKEEDVFVDRDLLLNDDHQDQLSVILLGKIDVPAGFESSYDDIGAELNFAPATKSSIEALEVIKVEEGYAKQPCAGKIDVPAGFESSYDDIGAELNFAPATKSSIEALEVIKVEEDYAKQPCAVCFEELLSGSEAILLHCSHVYHCGCIRKWFKMTN